MSTSNHSETTVWKPHVLSPAVLLLTAITLLGLTVLTIAAAQVELGEWKLVAALGIAAVKASIVGLFFMHLKYDKRFNSLVLVASIFFAAFFIGFVIFDTMQYQPTIRAMRDAEQAK